MSPTQPTDQPLTEQQKIERIYQFAAVQMRGGSPPQEIRRALQEKGLDAESSKVVVDDLSRLRENVRKNESQRNITHGAVWLAGGAAVVFLTYSSASSGGTQLIAWGAIVLGAFQMIRGFNQSRAK